jgi:phosphatidylglycerophosphate synthase
LRSYIALVREVRGEFRQTKKSGADWDSSNSLAGRYIYRPLGILFAPLFILISMSGNQVTLLSFLVGLAGIGLFLLGNADLFLAGALGYFAFTVLDFTDGLVARHERKSTHFGKMLDHMSGVAVSALAPIFIGFGVARAGLVPAWCGPDVFYLLLASLASAVNLMGKELEVSFALARSRVPGSGAARPPEPPKSSRGTLYLIRRLVFHASSETAHLVLIALTLLGATAIFPLLLLGLAGVKLLVVLSEIFRAGPRVLAIEKG